MDAVEQSLSNPVWCDSVIKCKLWALFAIGEVYATRTNPPGRDFPGMAYFAKASRLLGVLSERPTIDSIETINLLVSFFLLGTTQATNVSESNFWPVFLLFSPEQALYCLYVGWIRSPNGHSHGPSS